MSFCCSAKTKIGRQNSTIAKSAIVESAIVESAIADFAISCCFC